MSYLWRAGPQAQGIALTVDFGGGTLDLSVIRYFGMRFEVLSTAGTGLGGNRIDQMIYTTLLFPQLGEGETWTRQVDGRLLEGAFPFQEYESGLLNWQTTYLLNQNATKSKVVERIAQGGPAAVKFERLKDLISYNYSYNCFQAIRKAKAELSQVEATVLDIPEINLSLPFTRAMLDQILEPALATLRQLIDDVLATAGIERKDISLVIRTGGSSEIVAVRRLLDELFPGKVTAHDPFTSVAGGLAIAELSGHSEISHAAGAAEWGRRAGSRTPCSRSQRHSSSRGMLWISVPGPRERPRAIHSGDQGASLPGPYSSHFRGARLARILFTLLAVSIASAGISGTPQLTRDINALLPAVDSDPRPLGAVGSTVYLSTLVEKFSSSRALYRSDGTAAGTVLVKTFAGSGPAAFMAAGNKAYFVADESPAGAQVWVSDGTAEGTHSVKDFAPTSLGHPQLVGVLERTLYSPSHKA